MYITSLVAIRNRHSDHAGFVVMIQAKRNDKDADRSVPRIVKIGHSYPRNAFPGVVP